MLNRNAVFALFSLSVVFLLVMPSLVQHGMFMDGVQYACVAKNLAAGKGSFWFPYLSASWIKSGSPWFLEHPPLSYYLQSKFFLLFGNSVYSEKLYCLVSVVVCAFLISKIWKTVLGADPILKGYWWLAILLWFITPSVFWSFSNNMIENTVSIMVLATVYFCFKYLLSEKFRYAYLALAGIFIFLGSLSKGLPALFPLVFFFCFALITKKIKLRNAIGLSAVLIFIPLIIYTFICLNNEEARESLRFYVENRLFTRIKSAHTVENRFTILFWLLTDLFAILGFMLILLGVFKWKSFSKNFLQEHQRYFLFFIVFGLCGVLPLCFTYVQRATYFVPAIPFFAIASAMFVANGIHAKIEAITESHFKIMRICVIGFSICCVVLCTFLFGKTSRDQELFTDVRAIGHAIPRGEEVGSPYAVYGQWDFQFYLLRYYDITLFPREQAGMRFLIYEKSKRPENSLYEEESRVTLNRFSLFKKQN